MALNNLNKYGAPLAAFILAFASFAPAFPTSPTHAQGTGRTFPETGKSVTGIFLQYWDRNGGLAQQGFPISELIQETSATDGKIYNVQYFERAVFELHPENAGKPSEVLLSLLGNFLYREKYPNGAPGTTPNNEAGSRLFPETGKRLGGRFLQYWQQNGGLAQQGFPISDEFQEKSDLDGKTYKVQYFERAVFEFHPENRPPFDVLLSQLGTFRYRTRYGNLAHQLAGNGNRPTVPFTLKAGLVILQGVRADAGGYFYIDLANAAGERIATPSSGSGPLDISYAVNVPADGTYMLQVQAEGGWTVNVSQPRPAYSPPPASQRFSGRFSQATPVFSLKAGPARFHAISTNNKEIFRMALLNNEGRWLADIADSTGPTDVTESGTVPADGIYIVQVISDGDWTLEITQ